MGNNLRRSYAFFGTKFLQSITIYIYIRSENQVNQSDTSFWGCKPRPRTLSIGHWPNTKKMWHPGDEQLRSVKHGHCIPQTSTFNLFHDDLVTMNYLSFIMLWFLNLATELVCFPVVAVLIAVPWIKALEVKRKIQSTCFTLPFKSHSLQVIKITTIRCFDLFFDIFCILCSLLVGGSFHHRRAIS